MIKESTQPEGSETFEDYMRNARNEFVRVITKYFPHEFPLVGQNEYSKQLRSDIRVSSENILIAYDQMRERLATQTASPDLEKYKHDYEVCSQELENAVAIIIELRDELAKTSSPVSEDEIQYHNYKADWEYHCRVSGGHTFETFLTLLLDDPEFYKTWCSKKSPSPVSTQVEGIKSIYEMCQIDIPFYAYGDNEAACAFAEQITHIREYIVHELLNNEPAPSSKEAGPSPVSTQSLKNQQSEFADEIEKQLMETINQKNNHIDDLTKNIIQLVEWVSDGSKPEEKRRLLFVVGNDDMRFGKFYNEDQWERKWMFCDGSFFNIEQVKKWAYIPEERPAVPQTASPVSEDEKEVKCQQNRLTELLKTVVTREHSECHPHFKEEVWEEFKKQNNI